MSGYQKYYPAWEDSPSTLTPITAAALQHLDDAVFGLKTVMFNVLDYGALGDGSTDDTAAIQAAIDACSNAGGGVVYLPAGAYLVSASGNSFSGRGYSLLLKSGVSLCGVSSGSTSIRLANGANVDLVTTDRSGSASAGIAVKALTLDGNNANSNPDGFGIWVYNTTDVVIDDLRVTDTGSWLCRIDKCIRVRINNYEAVGTAELNEDGLHFVDTSQVTGANIYVYTEGDDGFVIETINEDVSDYALAGIYVQPKHTTVTSGLRGVLLLAEDGVVTGARTISDVNLDGVVVKNAYGAGVTLNGASYRNVRISAVTDSCAEDLYLQPGTSTYAGSVQNCCFDIVGANATGSSSIDTVVNYGTFRGNILKAMISNPPDGVAAVLLQGSNWSGSVDVDYNPLGNKVSPQQAVVIYGTFNDVSVSARDANVNLFLRSTAANNTLSLGYITGGVTADVEVAAGASNNSFSGGQVTTVSDAGTGTRFYGTMIAATPSVSSAATITLPVQASYMLITGTTTITSIVASWASRVVTLRFSSSLVLTDGSNLKLNGNFSTTTDDTITLVCDGTNWVELARSAN